MVKLQSLFSGIILIFLITACQTPVSRELPTRAVLPTHTFTPTSTDTPDVTNTPTPSDTPTATLTFTPSATATATLTPSATWTRPPSSTPTNTQTFTPAVSPTSTASLTPIPTRTSDAPVIENFTSNTTNTGNSSPVTLRWVVQADSARLEALDAAGNVLVQMDVDLIGTYSTNTPATGNVVTYRLTAIRGTQEVRSIITVDMADTCLISWYFPNPPSSAGCAQSPPQQIQVFFQQFERGFMFRANVAGASRTCGIQFDRNLYSCYSGDPYTGTPPSTAPAGLFDPNPLVADSYWTDLATGGFWNAVIGWGIEAGLNQNVQVQTGSDGKIYAQLPNGIYAFDSNLVLIGAPTTVITP